LEGVGATREIPVHYRRFFRGLGQEIRACRTARGLSQEDMIAYGFSARHWQMMEAGRPITVFTLLRICDVFDIPVEQFVASVAKHLRKDRKET
jgi:transcriptional regulator with XRE-family HTH domain